MNTAIKRNNVKVIGAGEKTLLFVHASLQAPELFEKLVMIGPSPRYIIEGEYFGGFDKEDIEELLETVNSNYLGWSSGFAPAIMGNEDRPELAEELENSFCQTNPAIAQHFAEVTFMGDDREYLDQVSTPTLILQCQSDVIAPMEVGEFVTNSIQNSTFKVLNATRHCPHMSAPEATSQAILQFLN